MKLYKDTEQFKKLIDELVEKQTEKKSKLSYFLKGLIVVFGTLVFFSGLFVLSLYLLAL
jgi:hypothetical protein